MPPQQESLDSAYIRYLASKGTRDLIADMGRTEDLKFSPDSRWIAIAGYRTNRIYVFAVRIFSRNGTKTIEIGKAASIRSASILEPHGIEFLGTDHLIVANRSGFIEILPLPPETQIYGELDIKSAATIKGDSHFRISSPGSVSSLDLGENTHRLLVCNNYRHVVSAHKVSLGPAIKVQNEGPLIRIGLDIPDGICFSPNRTLAAVSNHSTGSVFVYELGRIFRKDPKPCAVLKGVVCPHALRFTSDGKMLFVLDSASQYMHIYNTRGTWMSMKKPYKSIRMLDDEVFKMGRYNAQEGGLKGLDFEYMSNVVAVTSEHQPLAFYDANKLLCTASINIEAEIREKCLMRDREMGRTSLRASVRSFIRTLRGL